MPSKMWQTLQSIQFDARALNIANKVEQAALRSLNISHRGYSTPMALYSTRPKQRTALIRLTLMDGKIQPLWSIIRFIK